MPTGTQGWIWLVVRKVQHDIIRTCLAQGRMQFLSHISVNSWTSSGDYTLADDSVLSRILRSVLKMRILSHKDLRRRLWMVHGFYIKSWGCKWSEFNNRIWVMWELSDQRRSWVADVWLSWMNLCVLDCRQDRVTSSAGLIYNPKLSSGR